MTKLKFFSILSILFLIVCFVACQKAKQTSPSSPIEMLQAKIDPRALEIMKNPETAYVFEVKPDLSHKEGYQLLSSRRNLSAKAKRELQDLFLTDKSYIHDHTKSCLFLPTYGFLFAKDDDETLVLVSPSCKQIKIVFKNEDALFLDIDPLFPALEIFYQSVK